jgi:hypothetical protein|tara:strand:- start:7859 stop:8137 length:279 start_codon:yes stop_codon:yes gene_type:complete
MEDNKMNIVFITDQGHGWGIVSKEQLAAARMSAADFSQCSYQTPNGEIYALEEDCDFPKYLNKLDSMGTKYEITDRYVDEDHRDNPRSWDRI